MKKIILLIIVIILIAGCNNKELSKNKQLNLHEDHLSDFPYENISENEIYALNLTLNDEYKAEMIYQKVIEKFGNVKPFINIINAEKKHSSSLIELYNKYNLTVPENEWYDKVPEFDSITDACKAGVNAEIENAELYDDLFKKVDNQDIIAVFTSLRDASQYNHLPAFQKCANR